MSRYKCPACGAALHITSEAGEAVCDYCGCRADIQPPRRQRGYQGKMKYCRHCGKLIPDQAVICTECGCQVEELQQQASPEPRIVFNRHFHYGSRPGHGTGGANVRRKWVAFALCFFLGWIGAHKFYEGKYFWGAVYLFTGAFGGVGWLIDCLVLLFKPNPYYV